MNKAIIATLAVLTSVVAACGSSDPVSGAVGNGAATTIKVLSNRADLISGSDALAEVLLPSGGAA